MAGVAHFRRSAFALLSALVLLALVGCSTERREPTSPAPSASVAGTLKPRRTSLPDALAAQASANLLSIDGVAGDGIELDALGLPTICAYTTSSSVVLPAEIAGVPVTQRLTGRFRGFALTDRFRPVPIGVSLGNNLECLPGTVGAIVTKGGNRYVLCANHVLARQNLAQINEAIVQPSRVDGASDCSPRPARDVVARLSEFEPLHFDKTPNLMDAAIAIFDGATPTCATPPGYYGRPDATPVEAVAKLAIMKLGRTTGLTTGRIRSINVEVKVTLPQGDVIYTGQFMTSGSFGDFGDSGSLVVTNDADRHPVGMVIGGGSSGAAVCTPIGRILDRFGVTICTN